jgi:uncharacterized protein
MNKKVIGIIMSGLMLATALSACAAPVSNTTTGAPANKPGATIPTTAPDVGGMAVSPASPGIAPTPPTQGAGGVASPGIGATTPAVSPAMMINGGGYTSPTPVLNQYQNQNSGIVVTGQGQVQATPDIANLTLGVSSQQSTVAAAQTAAATAMNAVMQVLKGKGIADADITTVGFNINPVYDYRTNTAVITGYQVSNTINIKIRKIADVSSIIDASVTAGGNLITVNSISFGVNDPTPYTKQARAAAMADAKNKAGELAALGGVILGKPVYITESSGYYPPSPIYYAAGVASAKDIATPISPGQTQISVSVTVIYAMQ